MLKNLPCATDGSKASMKAVEFAIKLAKLENAALTFVTISTHTGDSMAHAHLEVDAASEEQINKELQIAEKQAKAAGLDQVRSIKAYGSNIAATLIDYAESNHHDHLITGSVGRTGVSRLLMGSIAYEVVSKAHCPVTIVR